MYSWVKLESSLLECPLIHAWSFDIQKVKKYRKFVSTISAIREPRTITGGINSVQTVAQPPSSVLHAAIARAPVTAMENVVAGIGKSCWESLPPTLCVDALGGRLARRWGALLRHLRLPRLGHQARLFVHLDPLLARNRRDQLADRFERQIVRRLEMNATLPHVELLPRRLERRLQLLELTRTPERAHQVERVEVLLRRERDVGDRLLVVSVWISREGDRPADRAPDEALIVAARNVLVHECAHRRDHLRTFGGE
jgi:hypothetical protein